MEKFGNWDKIGNIINNLDKDINASNEIALKKISLQAEKRAVDHMSKQDLGWKPLSEDYKKRKAKKQLSEKILIASSTYFQSITSWSDKKKAVAGVRKNVKNKDGVVIADLAKIHEYGSKSKNIPARPLWQPVFREMRKWIRTSKIFTKTFLERQKKKYGV